MRLVLVSPWLGESLSYTTELYFLGIASPPHSVFLAKKKTKILRLGEGVLHVVLYSTLMRSLCENMLLRHI